MAVVTYQNLCFSVPENETNLEYDYHFNTRAGLLGGKEIDRIYRLIFLKRFSSLVHNRQHPLHLHPDGTEDEEE